MKKLFSSLVFAHLLFAATITIHAQSDHSGGVLFTSSAHPAYSAFQSGVKFKDINNHKKAREYFDKAIEQDPKFVMAYVLRATYSNSPQERAMYLKKAKENLSQANEFEKLYYEFIETSLKNDLVNRLAIGQKMVAQYPDKARAYLLLGEAYNQAGEIAKSRANLQKAIELDPAWPAPYIQLTFSYLLQNPRDISQAEKHAKKLVSLAPAGSTYVLLGDAYRAQNKLAKAAEVYSRGIQMDPDLPMLFIKRGHVHSFMGNYDKARADYEQAGMLDDVPTPSRSYFALTYLYQGMPEKAIQWLLSDAESITKNMEASKAVVAKNHFFNLAAYIAMHINNLQQLKEIVALHKPISQELSSQAGTEEAKLEGKAERLYWEGMAKTLDKDFAAASQLAEEIKTVLEPINNPRKLQEYEFLLGQISLQQKDYQQAIAHFEKVNNQDVYVDYCIAKAYEAMGEKNKAKAMYNQLADYNFNNVGYALIRNELKKK